MNSTLRLLGVVIELTIIQRLSITLAVISLSAAVLGLLFLLVVREKDIVAVDSPIRSST